MLIEENQRERRRHLGEKHDRAFRLVSTNVAHNPFRCTERCADGFQDRPNHAELMYCHAGEVIDLQESRKRLLDFKTVWPDRLTAAPD